MDRNVSTRRPSVVLSQANWNTDVEAAIGLEADVPASFVEKYGIRDKQGQAQQPQRRGMGYSTNQFTNDEKRKLLFRFDVALEKNLPGLR